MPVFVESVHRTIAAQRLFASGSLVVVGVSGGADSMALLNALAALRGRLRLRLIVAHLDHAIRPSSADDAQFVRSAADRLALPVVIERWPVCELCERAGWSLEAGARQLRYEFLEKTAVRFGADCVTVAHTADDQAETVLMRLLRGSGLSGLSAIAAKRPLGCVPLVRPLLSLWRSEVLSFLKETGVSFREDESNQDKRFVRNRVRHELIPLLQESFNPNLKQTLLQLADQAKADEAYLKLQSKRIWKRIAKAAGSGRVRLRLSVWKRQPLSLRRQLIRKAIENIKGDLRAIEFRHWLEIEELVESRPAGSIVHLPGDVAVTKLDDGELLLAHVKGEGYTDSLFQAPAIASKKVKAKIK